MKNRKIEKIGVYQQVIKHYRLITLSLLFFTLIFSGCSSSSTQCDKLIGKWESESIKVEITKINDQYLFTLDSSIFNGSYPAYCENGKLKVNIPVAGTFEFSSDAFYVLGKKMKRVK
jgi:hypothetical protein